MTEAAGTVVVGAGQAGLAASYHLKQRGLDHVVLERGEIGETWRRERWDSFLLNTPNLFLHERRAVIRPDGKDRLAEAAAFLATFRKRVDDHVRAHGFDLPEEPTDFSEAIEVSDVHELPLGPEGIGTVLWANGFRPRLLVDRVLDLRLVRLAASGARRDGRPRPLLRRTSTGCTKSVLFLGVREDAEHVAAAIAR